MLDRGICSLAPAPISRALLAAPAVLSAALLAGAGCKPHGSTTPADAGPPTTDAPAPLTLSIAITGCDSYDPVNAHCTGAAPLVVYLSPVGSQEFNRFTWSFGDGSPLSTERAPMHEFLLPGTAAMRPDGYEIDLVGAFGTANTVRSTALVSVTARKAGQPCDFDLQCDTGLRCACAPGNGCNPAFLRGLCSSPCDAAPCGVGSVCAALALAPAPPPDGGPPLQAWCVASCQTNQDCSPGFACEVLAGAGVASPGTWTRGCLPVGALGDIGATCRDANGQLANAACATGSCLDLGALGSCSATCEGGQTCPPGTACASLFDGRHLCLADCAVSSAVCASDPLLACAAPTVADAAGGFRTDGGSSAGYCAPKPCTSDGDCAPAGVCAPGAQCALSQP
jgi:hypothetical protein